MNNLSMNQALSIWGDLWQAYYGKHHYGGDTAEIYVYRLMQRNPALDGLPDRTDIVRAQNSLYTMLAKFEHDNDCVIKVDHKSLLDWMETEVFDHRCHVRIIHN